MAEGKHLPLTDELVAYAVAHGTPPDEVQQALVDRTRRLGRLAGMQVPADQGALLTVLTKIVGVRLAVEVGTFTGYSTLCIARGLLDGGRVVTCDVSTAATAIARQFWDRAGVADRVDLRVGPGLDVLRSLPADPAVDLAFVDADKAGYLAYYEEIVPRLRPGGVVLLDNTLWGGRVADPSVDDEDTAAIRAVNERVAVDERVEAVVLTIGDGLTLARKR